MNKPVLFTVFTPRLLDLYELENNIVVIIDVFRATSTIAAALYNGAQKIFAVETIEECLEKGKKQNTITAGERDGKIIEGLQHGNSPLEYSPEIIKNKILVLTTTNGTKMLNMALQQNAEAVITGSFPNIGAVCDFLVSQNKSVILACSGWKDCFNLEDTLFAGALVNRIKNNFTIHCDSSLAAENIYLQHCSDLNSFIRQTTHWHRLQAYHLENDMEYCITENIADVLPIYDKTAEALIVRNTLQP